MTTSTTPDHIALSRKFLAAISDTYEKRWKRFQFQLVKHQLTDSAEAENVFSDTFVRCADRIQRAGMSTGTAFTTYFDKAVENNLLKFVIANNRTGNRTIGIEHFSNGAPDEHDENQDLTHSRLQQQRPPLHPEELVEELPDFDAEAYPSERQRYEALVVRLFAELPQKYQDVLTLVADGMRYREICRVLDLTKDQVKMRILTARRLMAEKVQLALNPEVPADFLELDEDER